MRYNLSWIMRKAWHIFRKGCESFAEALRLAWRAAKAQPENRQRIEAAKAAAEIVEECHSWSGWKSLGREVRHGERCVFQVLVIDPERKTCSRVKSFFTLSQTEPIPA